MANQQKREPTDEQRCTAVNRAGERCRQWLVKGTTKCRFHGSGGGRGKQSRRKHNPAAVGGRPIIHGRYSMRLKAIVEQTQADRLTELTEDPRLLDMSRTIATSQFLLEEYLPALTDEAIRELWKRRNPPPPGWDMEWEPGAGELLELKASLVASTIKALAAHGSMQAQARRTLAQEQLVAAVVVPILTRLGSEFMEVVAGVVTPEQLERIRVGLDLKSKRAVLDVHSVLVTAAK